jgi:hypothetical protein
MSTETMDSAAADADAAPLDLLLTDAALGVLNQGTRAAPDRCRRTGGNSIDLGAAA